MVMVMRIMYHDVVVPGSLSVCLSASWIFLKKQLFLLIGLNVTELGRQYNKFYHYDRFCFKQYRYNF